LKTRRASPQPVNDIRLFKVLLGSLYVAADAEKSHECMTFRHVAVTVVANTSRDTLPATPWFESIMYVM